MINKTSAPAPDLSHWDFSRHFSGRQAAALILGIDPTYASPLEMARAEPLLGRMQEAYSWARSAVLQMADQAVDRRLSSYDFPPGTLPSVPMLHDDVGELLKEWSRDPFDDFDNQLFSRREIQAWLNAEGFQTKYAFDQARARKSAPAAAPAQTPPDERQRTTYLNVIGALLNMMLEEGPTGKTRSGYKDEAAIKQGILARFPKVRGLSQRNLDIHFPAARKSIRED